MEKTDNILRCFAFFITILFIKPVLAADQPENLYRAFQFEKVIDPMTIQASGQPIKLWGVLGPEKDMPHYMAATWFLKSLMKDSDMTCKFIEKTAAGQDAMHCLVGNSDIGSMIIQMGLAETDQPYYAYEQKLARDEKRGLWKNPVSDRL